MKRGTPRHPKIFDLMQALEMTYRQRAVAVGTLELLWHFTAEFAPQGDIGKYSDARIESGADWGGRKGILVPALITSGWCDASDEHRVVVHDWHDHADDATRKKLQRGGLSFLSFRGKVTGQSQTMSPTRPDNGCLPEPEPEPEPSQSLLRNAADAACGRAPQSKRSGKRTTEQIIKALGDRLPWWEKFWELYPCKDGKLPGMDAFERVVTTREIAQAVINGANAYAKRYAADPTMKLKYAQGWLNDQRWTDAGKMPVEPPAPKSNYRYTPVEELGWDGRVDG